MLRWDMKDYNPGMGVLISLEDSEDFIPIKNSINLKLSKILDNPSKYLNKEDTYYFYVIPLLVMLLIELVLFIRKGKL